MTNAMRWPELSLGTEQCVNEKKTMKSKVCSVVKSFIPRLICLFINIPWFYKMLMLSEAG